MTIEMERATERLRPRILETEETGRLELSPPPATATDLPVLRARGSRSPVRVAATGFGILVFGLVGIDLVQFIDGAFARGTGLGIAATAAVAAGAGGAAYWLVAYLLGVWRLRSAELLRSLIPFALADELKVEIDAAAAILAADPLLSEAVARYRAVREPHHSGHDALELFSRFVLAPADRLADAALPPPAPPAFPAHPGGPPDRAARCPAVPRRRPTPHPRDRRDLWPASRAGRHRPPAAAARERRRYGRRRRSGRRDSRAAARRRRHGASQRQRRRERLRRTKDGAPR